MARFDDIVAGTDGEFTLTISFDGIAAEQYQGKYANMVMLREYTPIQ